MLRVLGLSLFGLFHATTAHSQDIVVHECDLVFFEDISAGQQKRVRTFVFSDAVTANDRAATAMSAALAIREQTGFDYVEVALTPSSMPRDRDWLSHSTASAIAKYAPRPERIPFMDRIWEVTATSAPLTSKSDAVWDHDVPPAGMLRLRKVDRSPCRPVVEN